MEETAYPMHYDTSSVRFNPTLAMGGNLRATYGPVPPACVARVVVTGMAIATALVLSVRRRRRRRPAEPLIGIIVINHYAGVVVGGHCR